ncbi:intraflagellar transport protein 88 [Holotrichia oblita]|uniref:Intraflagellar transport protein 88 n=1 Tax=Holotrichia oblita TaxID=644536 RepID=A0ACB9TUS3_HOLOL|nr:intraflagellar transport protein 88 [Holotrichia oblita]
MLHKYEDDEEDLEALFNKAHPLSSFLNENEILNRITSANKSKPSTATRLGTSSGYQRQGTAMLTASGIRPGTGFRPGTGIDVVNRPMTAVRGAGYTSQKPVFDPLNQGAIITSPTELQKDDSPEEKIRTQELKIMQLIEESCSISNDGNYKKALLKAKEASNKERNLIRIQEQAGLSDHHNMDLTYAVAPIYCALLNAGFRIKIMHNIGMVFVQMGQYEEAVTSLEFIMSEQPYHRAGLHLVLCCRALEDKERMKNAFSLLLAIPLEMEDEEKYSTDQDNPEDVMIATAIQNDDLHTYEKQKKSDAEYCILVAAKLIAPLIESTFSAGYDWCVDVIKNSEYARLAGDLEINKAVVYLKQGQLNEAIETLKVLDRETSIATSAATNLSFIYYLQGDYDNAEKYGEIVKHSDGYNAGGFVNLGACAMARSLTLKQLGHYEAALECFQKFTGSLALLPEIVFQVASLFERIGDSEAAAETYQQLLGLVPADATTLQKLGELFDHEGDKQQAHHYHYDSFRYYPANLTVIDWLGSYYIEMQVVEKALIYFEKAAQMQPNYPKWHMMVAGCHRRSGNVHKALILYQEIHRQFPENVECLRFLVRLCSDLGMRETQEYALELKKLEKSKEVRNRVNSSRPGSVRTGSGLSSRTGSGFSPVPENSNLSENSINSANRNSRVNRLSQLHNSAGSGDSGFAQPTVDASYSDPLGPLPTRPKTGIGKPLDFDDFGDEQLGDDLLPE